MHRLLPSLSAALAALALTSAVVLPSPALLAAQPTATPAKPTASPSPTPQQLVIPLHRAGLKGIVGHWWYVERYGTALLDHYARLGVTSVRLAVDWLQIEQAEGVLTFEHLDPIMDGFLERGIEVVPVVATIPVWASLNPEECAVNTMTCLVDAGKLPRFAETMRELVARYPEVQRWEFWNEPEMWVSMRHSFIYEPWYLAFYHAAKEANPRAVVAVGTLTGFDFIQHLSPDLPMDAATVHSYAGLPWGLDMQKIVNLHQGLTQRGYDIPVWVTEYGWNGQWMDSATRARTLEQVLGWMLSQPYIEMAHYHMLHDTEEAWECCYGLVGAWPELAPKQPSYDAFRALRVEGWTPQPRVRPSPTPLPGVRAYDCPPEANCWDSPSPARPTPGASI